MSDQETLPPAPAQTPADSLRAKLSDAHQQVDAQVPKHHFGVVNEILHFIVGIFPELIDLIEGKKASAPAAVAQTAETTKGQG